MSDERATVLVKVPLVPCSHGKRWAKAVTSVAELARTGHDYLGGWLYQGRHADLKVGDVVVCGGFAGSLKYGEKTADFYVVGPGGLMLNFRYDENNEWAIMARDEVRKVLAMPPEARVAYAAKGELKHYPPEFKGGGTPLADLHKIIEAGGAEMIGGTAVAYMSGGRHWANADDEVKANSLAVARQHLALAEAARDAWRAQRLALIEAHDQVQPRQAGATLYAADAGSSGPAWLKTPLDDTPRVAAARAALAPLTDEEVAALFAQVVAARAAAADEEKRVS